MFSPSHHIHIFIRSLNFVCEQSRSTLVDHRSGGSSLNVHTVKRFQPLIGNRMIQINYNILLLYCEKSDSKYLLEDAIEIH
jgi:hypothetical protein